MVLGEFCFSYWIACSVGSVPIFSQHLTNHFVYWYCKEKMDVDKLVWAERVTVVHIRVDHWRYFILWRACLLIIVIVWLSFLLTKSRTMSTSVRTHARMCSCGWYRANTLDPFKPIVHWKLLTLFGLGFFGVPGPGGTSKAPPPPP